MLTEDFGFAAEPFSIAPDPKAVFFHAAFRKVCADILVAHLSQRRGLVLLAGEPGVGKSTLLLKLLADRQIARSCIYLSCRASPSFEVLVGWCCAALGIADDTADHETKERALVDRLAQQLDNGGSTALLLDDGENLDPVVLESLHGLAEREKDGRPLVQIILAARLPNGAGANREVPAVAFPTRLDRIGPLEVGGYILCRLSSAGYEGPPLFSAEAIQRIARVTRGNPRLVNGLCQESLSIAAADNQSTVSAVIVEQALQEAPSESRDAKTEATEHVLPAADPAFAQVSPTAQSRSGTPQEAVWPIRFAAMSGEGHPAQGADLGRVGPGVASPWRQGMRFAAGLLVGLVIGAAGVSILKAYPGLGDKLSFDLLSTADRQKLEGVATSDMGTASGTPVVRKIVVVEQTAEGLFVQTTESPAASGGEEFVESPPGETEQGFGGWIRAWVDRLLPNSAESIEAAQRPER